SAVLLSVRGRRVKAGMVFSGRPTMTPRMASQDWSAIDAHRMQTLESLFQGNQDRLSTLSLELGGIYFDWSKTHLDAELLKAFVAIAEAANFSAARDALFSGAIVNSTEGRAAEHVAERG